jgi:tRNA dimethylallyltransferase
MTGKAMSQLQKEQKAEPLPYQVLKLALIPSDRALLHERIGKRFSQMLAQGLIDEVKTLKNRGDLHQDLPAIRAVGYRQVWGYLDEIMDYTEMEERGVIATRQLAKRQLTWLRSEKDLTIYDLSRYSKQQIQENVLKTVKTYLS